MTYHRYLYKICWRNKFLIPLILFCVFVVMGITLNFHVNLYEARDGRAVILPIKHGVHLRSTNEFTHTNNVHKNEEVVSTEMWYRKQVKPLQKPNLKESQLKIQNMQNNDEITEKKYRIRLNHAGNKISQDKLIFQAESIANRPRQHKGHNHEVFIDRLDKIQKYNDHFAENVIKLDENVGKNVQQQNIKVKNVDQIKVPNRDVKVKTAGEKPTEMRQDGSDMNYLVKRTNIFNELLSQNDNKTDNLLHHKDPSKLKNQKQTIDHKKLIKEGNLQPHSDVTLKPKGQKLSKLMNNQNKDGHNVLRMSNANIQGNIQKGTIGETENQNSNIKKQDGRHDAKKEIASIKDTNDIESLTKEKVIVPSNMADQSPLERNEDKTQKGHKLLHRQRPGKDNQKGQKVKTGRPDVKEKGTRILVLEDKNKVEETKQESAKLGKDQPILQQVVHKQFKKKKPFKPYHRKTAYTKGNDMPDIFNMWNTYTDTQCGGKFTGFYNEFAHLNNVVMDKMFCIGQAGGEDIEDVLNQSEESEYYSYLPGFFQLSCDTRMDYFFNNEHHISQWFYSVTTKGDDIGNPPDLTLNQFHLAITRYEYANIYHTMTDIYNAFLMMEFFNKSQSQTNILLIDGHPKGALDPIWSELFNSSTRISILPNRTKFTDLTWSILGYNSPMMDHGAPSIPYVSEFREFFLSTYRIPDNRILNCDKLSILFIWRHDYLAHPRNPSGHISRKIHNEEELVTSLKDRFPQFIVKGIQIDLLEMRQQLEVISKTDILIGMHGAGLVHAMFLPKTSAIIELLPTYWLADNEHFESIARWRGIAFSRWINTDPQNEMEENLTKIPPGVVIAEVEDIMEKICNENIFHHHHDRQYNRR